MVAMGKRLLVILFGVVGFMGFGQVAEETLDSLAQQYIIMEGDSVLQSSIALNEVYVLYSKEKNHEGVSLCQIGC